MFIDRKDAGRQLAETLVEYQDKGAIVVAVPRGGVVVGGEIARELAAQLDVVIARKVGLPQNPEVAIGAVTPDGEVKLNHQLMNHLGLTQEQLAGEIELAKSELDRRLQAYGKAGSIGGGHQPEQWQDRIVILTDDGIATGFTLAATIAYIRRHQPRQLILAVPVAPLEAANQFEGQVDKLICLLAPRDFYAVGQFYQDFSQVEDDQVTEILASFH